jgi:DNA (cytosine-5)-methyltransferase 1
MWKEMARIIGEVRPKFAFVENSPMLTTRGLGTVLRDLAQMGFDAEWGVLSAADVGANHKRERIWICAKQRNFFPYSLHNRDGWGKQQSKSIKKKNGAMADSKSTRASQDIGRIWEGSKRISGGKDTNQKMANSRCKLRNEGNSRNMATNKTEWSASSILNQSSGARFGFDNNWWEIEPNVGRMANGVALGVDRLKAIGNGQVPLCAATAWRLLNERL